MVKVEIRHGAEYWMLPFMLFTYLLPINVILSFFLGDSLILLLFLSEITVAITLATIASFIPKTKRILSLHFLNQRVTKEKKLKFWKYVSNYALIFTTVTHPILIMLLRLLFEELK